MTFMVRIGDEFRGVDGLNIRPSVYYTLGRQLETGKNDIFKTFITQEGEIVES